jgi:hypothetical protein
MSFADLHICGCLVLGIFKIHQLPETIMNLPSAIQKTNDGLAGAIGGVEKCTEVWGEPTCNL